MTDENTDAEPTQLTQPKGKDKATGEPYEPVEIPVPKRSEWDNVLKRASRTVQQDESQ
jgi:hypothetical protein